MAVPVAVAVSVAELVPDFVLLRVGHADCEMVAEAVILPDAVLEALAPVDSDAVGVPEVLAVLEAVLLDDGGAPEEETVPVAVPETETVLEAVPEVEGGAGEPVDVPDDDGGAGEPDAVIDAEGATGVPVGVGDAAASSVSASEIL